MAQFILIGQEYFNVAHILAIEACPYSETIWIRMDTGERYERSIQYLDGILESLGISNHKKTCEDI